MSLYDTGSYARYAAVMNALLRCHAGAALVAPAFPVERQQHFSHTLGVARVP